jgi:hypothetical protein
VNQPIRHETEEKIVLLPVGERDGDAVGLAEGMAAKHEHSR